MDTNQLLEGLARAVEAAKPGPEFCLFGFQHWSTCMTKAEWSGWVQALGSIAAILATAFGVWWQMDRQLSASENLRREEDKRKSNGTLKRSLFLLRKLRDVSVGILSLHEDFLGQREVHAMAMSKASTIPMSTLPNESGFLKENWSQYGKMLDSVVYNFSDLPYWDIEDADLANDLISIRTLSINCMLTLSTNTDLFIDHLNSVVDNIAVVEEKFQLSV